MLTQTKASNDLKPVEVHRLLGSNFFIGKLAPIHTKNRAALVAALKKYQVPSEVWQQANYLFIRRYGAKEAPIFIKLDAETRTFEVDVTPPEGVQIDKWGW